MKDRREDNTLIHSAAADYHDQQHVRGETPCPYLPNRMARTEAYRADDLSPPFYEKLLHIGFRRSGRIVYRPRCRSCTECRQIRVPVASFTSSRSQRRVWRKNADVRVQAGAPRVTDAKYALFREYLDHRHDGTMARTIEAFQDFLYDSPTTTLEFEYFIGKELAGVSIADRCPEGLSSVYMFYDPAYAARSLGTFSILREIEFCRREKLPFYYLGFFVAGCPTMDYKSRFRPNQLLVGQQRWLTIPG